MDEHKKMEEDKFQESSPAQQPREQEADDSNPEESMDQRQDGCKEGRRSAEEGPTTVQLKEVDNAEEEEPTVVQRKEVEVDTGCSEEASSPAWSLLDVLFASPCSVLQYLIRACTGWRPWGLQRHCAFDDGGGPNKPQAVAPEPNAATEEGDGGGGDKANNYFYMQGVVTRVWAVRMKRPPSGAPGHPREGNGGKGGTHH